MAVVPGISSSTDPHPIEDDGTHIDAPGLNLGDLSSLQSAFDRC